MFNKYFSDCQYMRRYSPTKLCDGAKMAIFVQRATCSTFHTCILNSHWGHTMCGSMVDIRSAAAEIRRGKEEEERRTRNVGQCPRDGRPAEYRWRPLQRRKVWLTPTTGVPCSNAVKTRNPLKLAGCPKLTKRSQPLVSRSSPYCKDMWGRYCCLRSFFSDCRCVP